MAGSFTGAAFVQVVQPRTGTTDGAGWCHRMARAVFDAPLVYGLNSATKAADATQFRHFTREMPNVAVPVWFDHWGTYEGVYGNWGHVVVWVPGHGFLSSPWHVKYGQEWYPSIEAVERTFSAKFRFISEDINGLRVAEPAPIKEVDEMPSTSSSNRKAVQKAGKDWTTLTVHEKGYISLMEGGSKARRVRGLINLAVSRGEIDVRAVRVVTNPAGDKQVSAHTLPFKTLRPGYGDYAFGLDLPKGKTNRLRLQVRARGKDVGQVDNVQALLDWWDQ